MSEPTTSSRTTFNDMPLAELDPQIAEVLAKELDRQRGTLEMIASENFVPRAVLQCQGSVLTNKYAEGYPGRRYYGGCEVVDVAESLAIERAKAVFQADWANVQPHSGSQANMAVYLSVLQPGDTILAMNLSHGGHLTHGAPVNFSGRLYNFVSYGVSRETGRIDMDDVERQAMEHKPKMIVCGASAYPREIDAEAFHRIAKKVGAYLMFDIAHIAGLVAAKLHKDPVPWCDFVTTTTHKTLRGPRGGMVMCKEEFAKALDKAIFPGMQGGPLMHVIAAKAVALKLAAEPSFAVYQRQTLANSKALAEALVGYGFQLVSGGTDNHLMLIDLRSKKLTGKALEHALNEAGLTVNKNAVPFDTEKPTITSGIRIGTPAVTTRGFREPEMKRIAEWIDRISKDVENESLIKTVRAEVRELCAKFPVYPDLV